MRGIQGIAISIVVSALVWIFFIWPLFEAIHDGLKPLTIMIGGK